MDINSGVGLLIHINPEGAAFKNSLGLTPLHGISVCTFEVENQRTLRVYNKQVPGRAAHFCLHISNVAINVVKYESSSSGQCPLYSFVGVHSE